MKASVTVIVAALAMIGASAHANTINLGVNGVAGQTGNVGDYTVTAAGAVNATPYNLTATDLTLSSDGYNDGNPVAGAAPANFNGFASFSTVFNLPADASAVTLNYTDLAANDRFTLELNGNILAQSGIYAPTTATAGTFVYTSGGAEAPATYQSSIGDPDGGITGSDSAFFNIGGANTLTVLVNATYAGYSNAGTADGLVHGDFKETGFGADSIGVTYDVPGGVPEPAAWALMLIGLGLVGGSLRQQRRNGALAFGQPCT